MDHTFPAITATSNKLEQDDDWWKIFDMYWEYLKKKKTTRIVLIFSVQDWRSDCNLSFLRFLDRKVLTAIYGLQTGASKKFEEQEHPKYRDLELHVISAIYINIDKK